MTDLEPLGVWLLTVWIYSVAGWTERQTNTMFATLDDCEVAAQKYQREGVTTRCDQRIASQPIERPVQ